MRTIGLIGGMSWESTAVYYRQINEAVRARLGGLASAKVALQSLDFSEVVALQKSNRRLPQLSLHGRGCACFRKTTSTLSC